MPRGGKSMHIRGGKRAQIVYPHILGMSPMPTTDGEGPSYVPATTGVGSPHMSASHTSESDSGEAIPDTDDDTSGHHSAAPELPNYRLTACYMPPPDGRLIIAPEGQW